MLRLTECPHCHTVYRYGDVRKIMNKKQATCYHCKKDFKISKINFLIFILIIALFCAIFNVFELYIWGEFFTILITNMIIITVGIILLPFAVRFKKFKTDNSNQFKIKADSRDYRKNNKKK